MKSKLPKVGTTIFTEMSALANQHGAINLSQGFPNYEPDPILQKYVVDAMSQGHHQYALMAGDLKLREQISAKLQKLYDVQVDPAEEITITAGATQAIFTTIMTFVHDGDEVIIIEPSFDCYAPAIELLGATVIPYEMQAPDFKVDWKKLEALMSAKTSMIIINTPHNPTGSILEDDDFKALDTILKERNIYILSDEVYEHLIYDDEEHSCILKYPNLRKKSIAVYSFGKTFHCTGWKVGYAIAPPELTKEFRKVHQFNVFSVNSFVQKGIGLYLANSDKYLDLPSFYEKKRDLFITYLQRSRFKVLPCKGSYFILCDYSEISPLPDVEFAKWLLIEHGVASIPVSVFYQSRKQESLVRFCFAKTEEILVAAGEILSSI